MNRGFLIGVLVGAISVPVLHAGAGDSLAHYSDYLRVAVNFLERIDQTLIHMDKTLTHLDELAQADYNLHRGRETDFDAK